jgi:hypothetical protein
VKTPTSADDNAQPFEPIEPFEHLEHQKPLKPHKHPKPQHFYQNIKKNSYDRFFFKIID